MRLWRMTLRACLLAALLRVLLALALLLLLVLLLLRGRFAMAAVGGAGAGWALLLVSLLVLVSMPPQAVCGRSREPRSVEAGLRGRWRS